MTEPTHMRVTPRVAGFRRAGRAWHPGDQPVSLENLTAEQVLELHSETELTVEFCAFEAGEQVPPIHGSQSSTTTADPVIATAVTKPAPVRKPRAPAKKA